jgi:hypothetical protein
MFRASQRAISLVRLDIQTAIMSMSQFRIAPRIGHSKQLQHKYSYLKRFKHGAIRVRTEKPDLTAFPEIDHDWSYSV